MSRTALTIGTILLVLMAGATLLFSQTGITVDMLRLTGPGDIIMRVGQILQPVQLDLTGDFNLDTTTTPPTLRIVPPPMPEVNIRRVTDSATVVEASSTIAVQGTPLSDTLSVYRNGVRLSAGLDYNYSPTQGQIVFLETAKWNNIPKVGDIVLVEFWEPTGG